MPEADGWLFAVLRVVMTEVLEMLFWGAPLATTTPEGVPAQIGGALPCGELVEGSSCTSGSSRPPVLLDPWLVACVSPLRAALF